MRKLMAITTLAVCGVLASPSTALAFNPQPDPPGRVQLQVIVSVQGGGLGLGAGLDAIALKEVDPAPARVALGVAFGVDDPNILPPSTRG